jgi:hemolysin activation/secretion protein
VDSVATEAVGLRRGVAQRAARGGIALALLASTALVAPATLRASEARAQAAPSAQPQSQPAPRLATRNVSGFVFLDEPTKVRPGGWPGVTGIDTSKAPSFARSSAFDTALKPFLGQPISIDLFNRVIAATVLAARSAGYPVVDVIVPEQDVDNGTVQVLVVVGRLGKITAEGNKWFSSADLTGGVRLKAGDPIRSDVLNADLAWLNNNPFRSIDSVFVPGQKPGTTDIVLKTTDRFPLRTYVGFANDGTKATGEQRGSVGFSWGDAFWLGHRLDYQYSHSIDNNRFQAHTGAYVIPLPWRDLLTFTVSYDTSHAPASTSLDTRGEGWQFTGRYTVPLPRIGLLGGVTHEAAFGLEDKRNNSNLEFGGVQVFNVTPEVFQMVADYNAGMTDDWGVTSFTGDFYYSPGHINHRNSSEVFREARPGTDASYRYLRLHAERLVYLPGDMSLTARASAQYANHNLLFSERLSVGGFQSVRGYPESHFTGDLGYLASIELRSPSFSVLPHLGWANAHDQMQWLLFFDYGVAQPYEHVTASDTTSVAESVGFGMRYSVNPYLTARFDYGYPLRRDNTSPPVSRNGQVHFGVVVGY